METTVKKASKIKAKVIDREDLLERVREAVADPDVKAGTVFIAGVTKAKEYKGSHQMMLEVVQKKQLTQNAKVSVLSALNAGDERFRANTRTLRVWLKITAKGFDSIFTNMGITGDELHEGTKDLTKEQVLMTFARVRSIKIEGVDEIPTISVKQYSAEEGLPSKIQKILDTDESDRTDEQDQDLKRYEMRTVDGDPLVDLFGNQVYELNELTYGEEEDIIIKKMPLSEYKKQKKAAQKETPKEFASLVD